MHSRGGVAGTEAINDATVAIAQQRSIPEAVRRMSTISDPDYMDFTVMTTQPAEHLPERWAREVFEEAFRSVTGRLVLAGLLRLRLAPRMSPDSVGGLKIAAQSDSWIRLEAGSRLLSVQMVLLVREPGVSVATMVSYHHPWGAFLWSRLSGKHRRELKGLLRQAHGSLSRRGERERAPSS